MIIGLLTGRIIAQSLGVESYGAFAVVWSIMQVGNFLTDGGFSVVFSSLIGEWKQHEKKEKFKKYISAAHGFRAMSYLLVILFFVISAYIYPWSQDIREGIFSIIPFAILSTLATAFSGWWQIESNPLPQIYSELISKLSAFFGMMLLAQTNFFSVQNTMIVYGLSSGIQVMMSWFFLREFKPWRVSYDKELWRKIWNKSWPISLMLFFTVIYFKGDTIMIEFLRPKSEVGWYGLSYRFLEIIVVIPAIFATYMLPRLSSMWNEKREYFSQMLLNLTIVSLLGGISVLVVSWNLAPYIILFISNIDFLPATYALQPLSIAAMIIFVAQIWQFTIIAIGKQKKLISFFLGMALLAPVLYFFSITRYGYIGAAWVTVLVELIMTIVYGYILNMEKIKLFNQNTLKFILPIFIIGTTSLLIGDIQGLIFFIIITLTWIIFCKKNKYYDILTLLKYLIS